MNTFDSPKGPPAHPQKGVSEVWCPYHAESWRDKTHECFGQPGLGEGIPALLLRAEANSSFGKVTGAFYSDIHN